MKARIRNAHFLGVIALQIFLLSGCSTPVSVPLSVESRASVKQVYVDSNVPKPEVIYWRGSAQAWGAVFGAIGAAATYDSGVADGERMSKFMAQQHIDISEIVFSEAVKQMAALQKFELVDSSNADTLLRLSVDMYGFNKTHPFGSNMNPLIRITGRLVKSNNQVLWQESEVVSDFAAENDQGQSLETYRNEPEKLRAALVKASAVAVKRILAKLP